MFSSFYSWLIGGSSATDNQPSASRCPFSANSTSKDHPTKGHQQKGKEIQPISLGDVLVNLIESYAEAAADEATRRLSRVGPRSSKEVSSSDEACDMWTVAPLLLKVEVLLQERARQQRQSVRTPGPQTAGTSATTASYHAIDGRLGRTCVPPPSLFDSPASEPHKAPLLLQTVPHDDGTVNNPPSPSRPPPSSARKEADVEVDVIRLLVNTADISHHTCSMTPLFAVCAAIREPSTFSAAPSSSSGVDADRSGGRADSPSDSDAEDVLFYDLDPQVLAERRRMGIARRPPPPNTVGRRSVVGALEEETSFDVQCPLLPEEMAAALRFVRAYARAAASVAIATFLLERCGAEPSPPPNAYGSASDYSTEDPLRADCSPLLVALRRFPASALGAAASLSPLVSTALFGKRGRKEGYQREREHGGDGDAEKASAGAADGEWQRSPQRLLTNLLGAFLDAGADFFSVGPAGGTPFDVAVRRAAMLAPAVLMHSTSCGGESPLTSTAAMASDLDGGEEEKQLMFVPFVIGMILRGKSMRDASGTRLRNGEGGGREEMMPACRFPIATAECISAAARVVGAVARRSGATPTQLALSRAHIGRPVPREGESEANGGEEFFSQSTQPMGTRVLLDGMGLLFAHGALDLFAAADSAPNFDTRTLTITNENGNDAGLTVNADAIHERSQFTLEHHSTSHHHVEAEYADRIAAGSLAQRDITVPFDVAHTLSEACAHSRRERCAALALYLAHGGASSARHTESSAGSELAEREEEVRFANAVARFVVTAAIFPSLRRGDADCRAVVRIVVGRGAVCGQLLGNALQAQWEESGRQFPMYASSPHAASLINGILEYLRLECNAIL